MRRQSRRIVQQLPAESILVFTNLVTDQPAYCRAADGSDRTATRDHGSANGANTGANCSALVALGHSGTPPQSEHHGDYQSTDGIQVT